MHNRGAYWWDMYTVEHAKKEKKRRHDDYYDDVGNHDDDNYYWWIIMMSSQSEDNMIKQPMMATKQSTVSWDEQLWFQGGESQWQKASIR